MKNLKYIFAIIILKFVFTACANTSTHPLLRQQAELIATEVRINIYISDDIQSARINNFPLNQGSNYLRVPEGSHVLYWSKKGTGHTRNIRVDRINNKFIIF